MISKDRISNAKAKRNEELNQKAREIFNYYLSNGLEKDIEDKIVSAIKNDRKEMSFYMTIYSDHADVGPNCLKNYKFENTIGCDETSALLERIVPMMETLLAENELSFAIEKCYLGYDCHIYL